MDNIDGTTITLIFGFVAVVGCQLAGIACQLVGLSRLTDIKVSNENIEKCLAEMNRLLVEVYKGVGILSAQSTQVEPPKKASG